MGPPPPPVTKIVGEIETINKFLEESFAERSISAADKIKRCLEFCLESSEGKESDREVVYALYVKSLKSPRKESAKLIDDAYDVVVDADGADDIRKRVKGIKIVARQMLIDELLQEGLRP